MDLFKSVIHDINKSLVDMLTKKFLLDITTPKTFNNQSIISYTSNPDIIKDISEYQEGFRKLLQTKQYLCMLNDAGLIQGFYIFTQDGKKLIKGGLAYYPNPGFKIDADFNVTNPTNDVGLSGHVSKYVRIDFDPSSEKELLHPCSHIHIGFESNYRIALNKFPFFSEFVRLILFLNYREDWLKIIPHKNKGKNIEVNISEYLKLRSKNEVNKYIPSRLTSCEMKHYHINI